MKKYKEAKNLRTLLALCFSDRTGETFHHWQVFSSGSDGVSIRFKKDRILNAFKKKCKEDDGVPPFDRSVKYTKICELQRNPPDVDDLPFLKWAPYGDEREYRIVYANHGSRSSWGFEIELEWIDHISLSPWLPAILESPVCDQLSSIPGCSGLRISRSRVINFAAWKAAARRTVGTKGGSFDPVQLERAWPGDEPIETLLAKLD